MPPRSGPRVLSYDAAITRQAGELTVHALFPHAWHLRGRNGWILSVVDGPWNGPLTIRLPALPPALGLSPGATGVLREHALHVGRYTLSLDGAAFWRPAAVRLGDLQLPRLQHDLQHMQCWVQAAQRGGLARADSSEAGAWARRGAAAISSLEEALAREDPAGVAAPATGLVGLGPGLTPAGDDLLCGLLAGLSVLGRRAPHHMERSARLVEALSAGILPGLAHRTTSFSGTLLRAAADGVAAEPLMLLLGTVGDRRGFGGLNAAEFVKDALLVSTNRRCSRTLYGCPPPGTAAPTRGATTDDSCQENEPDRVRALVDAVLMLGHSSGSDMLTGAMMACAAVLRWEEVLGPAMARSR